MDVILSLLPLVGLVVLMAVLLRLSARRERHARRSGAPADLRPGSCRAPADQVFARAASFNSGS